MMTKEWIWSSEYSGREGEESIAGKLGDGKNSVNSNGMGFFSREKQRGLQNMKFQRSLRGGMRVGVDFGKEGGF